MPDSTPKYEQLIAYAAGQLMPAESASVAAYIAGDERAADVVHAWQAVQQIVADDDTIAPSAAALAQAKAVFISRASSSQAESARNWIDAVDRFIARLLYDSRAQPAALRFAESRDRITLTFDTGAGEVDVQAERQSDEDDEAWSIIGQVTEPEVGAREIAMRESARSAPIQHAVTNEHGEFALRVQPGEYELLLRRGNTVVVMALLVLDP